MDKKQFYYLHRKFRYVKPWYFLALAIISAVICVWALRTNNYHMGVLRDKVYSADKSGGDVTKALQNLQAYVTTHMNTNLSAGPNTPYPPIQLKYTYDRLVQASGETANTQNSKIYTDAQAYCEKTVPNGFSGRYRIDCIQNYVTNHGVEVPNISDSLYKFSFSSPAWSPDLAGWTTILAIVSFIAFLALWLTKRWLKRKSR